MAPQRDAGVRRATRCRSRSATSSGCATALDAYGPETLLLLFAQAHYRSPLEYSPTTLEQAQRRLRAAARGAGAGALGARRRRRRGRRAAALRAATAAVERFDAALDDDLATPEAVAALFGLARDLNQAVDAGAPRGRAERAPPTCSSTASTCSAWPASTAAPATARPPEVAALAEERDAARAARDFARADALRDEIAALGWEVRDTAQGREFRRR